MSLKTKRFSSPTPKLYWYENGKRQGCYGDMKNVWSKDGIERGREIYDPRSNAWYWLDAINGGEAAVNKTVWIPYIRQDETPGSTDGKWCRYDYAGKMMKGWVILVPRFKENDETAYTYCHYDSTTGAEDQKIAGSSTTFSNWKNGKLDWTWIVMDEVYTEEPVYYMTKENGPKQ